MENLMFDKYTKAYVEFGYDFEDGIIAQVRCGKCDSRQPIYLHEETGLVEDIVFDCCECGERNVLRCR